MQSTIISAEQMLYTIDHAFTVSNAHLS